MNLDDFFLTEDFTTSTPTTPQPADKTTPEQGTLFDACAYQGPANRRGTHNTPMLDPFGHPAI